jgi:hypothetical protein
MIFALFLRDELAKDENGIYASVYHDEGRFECRTTWSSLNVFAHGRDEVRSYLTRQCTMVIRYGIGSQYHLGSAQQDPGSASHHDVDLRQRQVLD